MMVKGNSRSNGAFFSKHLMNGEDNERVTIAEIKGFTSDNLPDIFKEISIIAAGTRAENPFYHGILSPRAGEQLTPEQWEQAADTMETNLRFEGLSRVVVEHEKGDITHRHIIWNRIDPDTMTARSDSFNYQAHDKTRHEVEQLFDHEPTPPTPEPALRKSREFAGWEQWRGSESGISPAEMKAEITALWQQSDGGRAFQAALDDAGYLLAKGDRRDFVLVDQEGDIHSLARRIDGAKAADIRAKMSDLDRDSLMTAQEASAWMKGKDEAENSGSSDARILPEEQAHIPTIYERADRTEAMLREKAANMTAEEWAQEIEDNERAWNMTFRTPEETARGAEAWKEWQAHYAQYEQARLARIAARQEQPNADHDPPAGEPPVEPVSFEQTARGIDPPQNFNERESGRSDKQTWVEVVTRKDKTDEKEPELER